MKNGNKTIIATAVVLLIVTAVFASSTITTSASRLERGLRGAGAIKDANIVQTRVNEGNDANSFSGQQSFQIKSTQTYIINGYLQGVYLKGTGTDSNGVTLTLKGHSTGIKYFTNTGITDSNFFALDYAPIDANRAYVGVPINEVLDANWSNNDYNEMIIGILWQSNKE